MKLKNFKIKSNWTNAQHANEIAPLIFEIQNPESRIQNWLECIANSGAGRFAQKLSAIARANPAENLSPRTCGKTLWPGFAHLGQPAGEFAACPFRFFVRSGLRADERKVFELDARERGSFQHDVLKTFHDS